MVKMEMVKNPRNNAFCGVKKIVSLLYVKKSP